MPVQNSIHKLSAYPDLATQLVLILISNTFNTLLCPMGNLLFTHVLGDGFIKKRYMVVSSKKKILSILPNRNCCLSKTVFRKLHAQKMDWKGSGLYVQASHHSDNCSFGLAQMAKIREFLILKMQSDYVISNFKTIVFPLHTWTVCRLIKPNLILVFYFNW